MVVRVRIEKSKLAALAALFAHTAWIAFIPGAWLLLADLGWTLRSGFPATGVFSHWQLWTALALALFGASWRFRRHAAGSSTERF
jgi:hypothetical protein